MSDQDRISHLMERGWRPRIDTHEVGQLSRLERTELPGPWTITRHEGEVAFCTGFVIYMRPVGSLARTSRRTGVYATIAQALDEAEKHADNEEARTSR